jgi:hypothetical protein
MRGWSTQDTTMIEIILLIFGLIYAVRRPKVRQLGPAAFPTVPEPIFREWQQAELRAIDTFLWATWGAFGIKLALIFLVVSAGPTPDTVVAFQVLAVGGWIVGLIVAAMQGSSAKRLRTAAGICWPR